MRRVVITGLGVISPVGSTVDTFWKNLVNGQSGVKKIKSFDTSALSTKIAGVVEDFDPEFYISKKQLRHMDRFVQFAAAASIQAVKQSGLKIDENADRVGV